MTVDWIFIFMSLNVIFFYSEVLPLNFNVELRAQPISTSIVLCRVEPQEVKKYCAMDFFLSIVSHS